MIRQLLELWRPNKDIVFSKWCEENIYLESGRFRARSYQKAILDSFTDPLIEFVIVKKSARVGYTQCMSLLVVYYTIYEPCDVLIVQPTVKDSRDFSQENIQDLVLDNPHLELKCLSQGNILKKNYPGGSLTLIGAVSSAGFRRIGPRIAILDELSAYSNNTDGDQFQLAVKRTESQDNHKIIAGSTPGVFGICQISKQFEDSSQDHYYIECPNCSTHHTIDWKQFKWDEGKPDTVVHVCPHCSYDLQHSEKFEALELGEWRSHNPTNPRKGFFIWSGYSYDRNCRWSIIVAEWEKSIGNRNLERVFYNTYLGLSYDSNIGKQLDWEQFKSERAENYSTKSIPQNVKYLFAGVDVQSDYFQIQVIGVARNLEIYIIDSTEIHCDTFYKTSWDEDLDAALSKTYLQEDGVSELKITMTAIDTGYQTQEAYTYIRYRKNKCMAIKGLSTKSKPMINRPNRVDVNYNGKTIKNGVLLRGIGSHSSKNYCMDLLENTTIGPQFVHFPKDLPDNYYKNLLAEKLIIDINKKGMETQTWVPTRKQNEEWDTFRYAVFAAIVCDVERLEF